MQHATPGSQYEGKSVEDLLGKTTSKLLANPTDKEEQQKLMLQDIETQNKINQYNKDLEYACEDVRFKNKHFVGNSVIVKLEKLNWFIPSDLDTDLFTINPLQMVAATTPDHPKGKIIENPLPYNYRGVVVAVCDEVVKYRAENNLAPLEAGDIVELNWFDVKQFRYYPNKNKIDQITLDSPDAANYEGFAKIPAQFVEAIVKPNDFELVYNVSREEMYNVQVNTKDITTMSNKTVEVHKMHL